MTKRIARNNLLFEESNGITSKDVMKKLVGVLWRITE
jgi:hypothetical protein